MAGLAQEELPPFKELVNRFSLFASSASQCNTQIGANGSLSCNCKGCVEWYNFVEGRDSCYGKVQYEVLTQEHVSGLAHYLRARAVEYELPAMKVLEVGAGGGQLTHHLNCFLAQSSRESQDLMLRVTATDSGQRGLNGFLVKKQDALDAITEYQPHVVISSWMGYGKGSLHCKPVGDECSSERVVRHIVVTNYCFPAQFKPMGVDWTAHMRATSSVREYILIGETDLGICGHPWLTWGISLPWDSSDSDNCEDTDVDDTYFQAKETFYAQETEDEPNNGILPQKRCCFAAPVADLQNGRVHDYNLQPIGRTLVTEQDPDIAQSAPSNDNIGWERVELETLSKVQICRTDERWSTTRHSHTISFRKGLE